MPDEPAAEPAPENNRGGEGVFSGFGVASTVLAAIAVGAVVLVTLIWSAHDADVDERHYQTDVLQAAVDWTSVLVNMTADNVEVSLQQLQEGTVGALNADFESALQPYTQLVQRLQSRTQGQVNSVAIESRHRELPPPGGAPPQRQPQPQPELDAVVSRTDTVLVVATSVSENVAGDPPQTVRWNLRLDVSEVDGELFISRLETIR